MPVLGHHVACVIGWCTEKEVIRMTTRRIVATMADEQAVGDRSLEPFIGKAMNRPATVPVPHPSVSRCRIDGPSPYPTALFGRLVWHEVGEYISDIHAPRAQGSDRNMRLNVTMLVPSIPVRCAPTTGSDSSPTSGDTARRISHRRLLTSRPNPGPFTAGAGTLFYQPDEL